MQRDVLGSLKISERGNFQWLSVEPEVKEPRKTPCPLERPRI